MLPLDQPFFMRFPEEMIDALLDERRVVVLCMVCTAWMGITDCSGLLEPIGSPCEHCMVCAAWITDFKTPTAHCPWHRHKACPGVAHIHKLLDCLECMHFPPTPNEDAVIVS